MKKAKIKLDDASFMLLSILVILHAEMMIDKKRLMPFFEIIF